MRALPPGRAVDLLHGVPFGQPAHPALVRLPIGCWTSAVLLDLWGGRGPEAERASATLIAVGVAWLLGNAGRIDLLATLRAWWPLTLVVWGVLELVAFALSRDARRS